MNKLLRHINTQRCHIQFMTAFEQNHRTFLEENPNDYFPGSTPDRICFYASARDLVSDHFGADDWMVRSGAYEKVVDNVTIVLVAALESDKSPHLIRLPAHLDCVGTSECKACAQTVG